MADTMSAARAMWTMFEPVHDVTYFVPEALSAFTEAGLRGYWRGYFAGRAAPLGRARAAVVTASFYNFAPAFVGRAIPGVWDLVTPEEAIAVREAGAAASLRRLLDGREAEAAKAADLLWRAAEDLDFAGRVLSAANSELPISADPLTRLWQAATLLREHRGDRRLRRAGRRRHRRLQGGRAAVREGHGHLPRSHAARPWLDRRAVGGSGLPAGGAQLGRRGRGDDRGRPRRARTRSRPPPIRRRRGPGTGSAPSAWPRWPTCSCRSPGPARQRSLR